MSAWTTLEMAKKQVGIPLSDCANDDWLRMILAAAEQACLEFLQNASADVPVAPPDKTVSHAMYMQFAEFWRFRGDDENGDPPKSFIPGAPSEQVCRLLLPRRPHSLA